MSDEPLPFDDPSENPIEPVAPEPKKRQVAKPIELTDDQKTFVATHWANPEWDLKRITCHVFGDSTLDGHHPEGKAVRAYIATLGQPEVVIAPSVTPSIRKGRYELTPEQKTNIEALLNQENPPAPKEIFKLVFPNLKEFSYLGNEYKAISTFIKETNEEAVDIWEEPVTERRYKPPTSWNNLLGVVNKCVGNRNDVNRALYDPAKMKPSEERNIKALFSYMKIDTFINRASRYERKMDRDTFIATFIRNVQDKAMDLIPEEVDAYMDLAGETVQAGQIEREIQGQQKMLSDAFEGDDESGNKAKASMSLVEALNNNRDKLKESKKRIDTLRKDLAGSRKDRIDSKKVQNDHLGNWFALWVEEQTRKDLIELAKKEHAADKVEYGRIKSADDSWALIAGLTEEEATGGI